MDQPSLHFVKFSLQIAKFQGERILFERHPANDRQMAECRSPGSRKPIRAAYAEELVTLRPDVIFAISGPAARGVQERTQTIPIVFVGGGDAVDNNFVNSVARSIGHSRGGRSALPLRIRHVPLLYLNIILKDAAS